MTKKIVFCADGTWNHPHRSAEVRGQDTNVVKLFRSLIAQDGVQLPFYDKGVGTSQLPVEHLLGGIFGDGLFQKIRDGYRDIARHYEAGDELYIFGFSRGAYTARSLAGMIAICGLPIRNNTMFPVDTAFQAYRNKNQRQAILASLSTYGLFDAKITMLGVWDTVGTLGIPGAFGDARFNYGFLDTSLHVDVLSAYHALSIDERRREFPPTLWTGPPATGQMVEQVWFAGVHSDVGGGYEETALSDIALSWMLNKAVGRGLLVRSDAIARYGTMDPAYALGTIHESWHFWWLPFKRRDIPDNAVIANGVNQRIQGNVGYHPPNLKYDLSGPLASGYGSEKVV